MFKKPTPLVLGMIVALVAIFVVFGLGSRLSDSLAAIYGTLALIPALVVQGQQVWSVVTYALLHDLASPFHLIFNCLILYWFGPDHETRWGKPRFATFCAVAALVGGVFPTVAYALGLSNASVVGASAITSALTLSWGLSNKDRPINFFFVPMKGIHLVYIMLAFELLNAVSHSGVSAASHFGGMAVGYLLGDASPLRQWFLQRRLRSLQKQSAALRGMRLGKADPGLRVIQGGASSARKPRKEDLN
jgi:membrane associated rhomboid family serine protease